MYSRRPDGARQRNHKTKKKQENRETTTLVIDNVMYAPDCPIQISTQQLHRQSKVLKIRLRNIR
jgi:hypothetical protein